MKRNRSNTWGIGALAMAAMLAAGQAYPCSVCFGDPASPMTKGAKAGVIALAIMVYMVLMMMGSVGLFWFFRARKLKELAISRIDGQNQIQPPR